MCSMEGGGSLSPLSQNHNVSSEKSGLLCNARWTLEGVSRVLNMWTWVVFTCPPLCTSSIALEPLQLAVSADAWGNTSYTLVEQAMHLPATRNSKHMAGPTDLQPGSGWKTNPGACVCTCNALPHVIVGNLKDLWCWPQIRQRRSGCVILQQEGTTKPSVASLGPWDLKSCYLVISLSWSWSALGLQGCGMHKPKFRGIINGLSHILSHLMGHGKKSK